MDSFWFNFAIEIGFLSLLGVAYYFYQKRKILTYEENKTPLVMTFFLETCLSEKIEASQPGLDQLIEALDDYLIKKTTVAPLALLKSFSASSECSPELRHAIQEGLKEIE